ncbi:MAG TPA: glycerol-3-phosphate 1-O-acyltransferase, partial [Spirochaetes bacterium]|nr:glycerol-3-phosphate 1-O-acyltransferase [Spirochaetota bacterium]
MGLNILMILLYFIAAYIAGSIPSGYIITKLLSNKDIRDSGSGGTGATNVSRHLGIAYGLLTVVLDALKGVIPLIIGRYVLSNSITDQYVLCGIAFFSIFGHIYPLFLRFKGGKGVATFIGVMLFLLPLETAFFLLLYVMLLLVFRYSSLASIVSI